MTDYLSTNLFAFTSGFAAGLLFRGIDTHRYIKGTSTKVPLTTTGGKVIGGAGLALFGDILDSIPFLGGDGFGESVLRNDVGIIAGYTTGAYTVERIFRFASRKNKGIQSQIKQYDSQIKGISDAWYKSLREGNERVARDKQMKIYSSTIPVVNDLMKDLENGDERMLRPVAQYIPDGIVDRNKVRIALHECLDNHTIPSLEKSSSSDPRKKMELDDAKIVREKLREGKPVKYRGISL